MVQDTATGADFTVQRRGADRADAGSQERVEIQWIVIDAQGDERGRVVQLNDVPAGSLDGYGATSRWWWRRRPPAACAT